MPVFRRPHVKGNQFTIQFPDSGFLEESQLKNTAGDDHSDKLDHTNYRRVDCDLFVEKNISLREALCGFTCTLYPLDGRNVGVSRSPGAVLSPGVEVFPAHRTWPHQHWTQRQRKWI
ncbi:uncharacterized protein LOC135340769 isoform X6 [Halichondria panicea]|uniref:uncharacterized protein LOC135340769 isoform X6 n=1 Tax=Halichondria panicea TaxID=6063 RepID=UPI00312B2F2D